LNEFFNKILIIKFDNVLYEIEFVKDSNLKFFKII